MILGLFGLTVIKKSSKKAVYRDCNGIKFVKFTKE